MKSVVADPAAYDWEGDRAAPALRSTETIIYEMHVRGFTRHPSSGVDAEQARHLRGADREDPVSQGSRHHRRRTAAGVPVRSAGCAAGRVNYWGYQPVSFFAPHHAYSSRREPLGGRSTNSATWSRRCTARASRSSSTSSSITRPKAASDGPTFCYRGLANDFYYILEDGQIALRRLHRAAATR